ncbi:hypothetical protein YC2023_012095 [Brassica napus]
MTQRCSHCNHNGHNSRTCPNRGVVLFGVRLTEGSIRKSARLGPYMICKGMERIRRRYRRKRRWRTPEGERDRRRGRREKWGRRCVSSL